MHFPTDPEDLPELQELIDELVDGMENALESPQAVRALRLQGGLMGNISSLDIPVEIAQLESLELLVVEHFSAVHFNLSTRNLPQLKNVLLLGNEFAPEGMELDLNFLPEVKRLFVDVFYPFSLKVPQGHPLELFWIDESDFQNPEVLSDCGQLKTLSIDANLLQEPLTTVESLRLHHCKEVPKALLKMPKLRYLQLQWCDEAVVKALQEALPSVEVVSG